MLNTLEDISRLTNREQKIDLIKILINDQNKKIEAISLQLSREVEYKRTLKKELNNLTNLDMFINTKKQD